MSDPNVAFCRTLVDEWVRAGITDAFVAPGSRSTPLAVAVADALRTHVILDERSAAFAGLGLALASGRPTVLVCTSGTAAAEFHAAVVEASQAFVPLIVCTADRPPELWGVGAPQTIDQVGLYGTAVRWFHTAGTPDPATAPTWRALAARAVIEATRTPAGPVHLNLPFREPLLAGSDLALPPGRGDGSPWTRRPLPRDPGSSPRAVVDACGAAVRPIVVTGEHGAAHLATGSVPVLGDHRGPHPGNVAHWDLLLRDPGFAADHRPDLVIRTGTPPASKALTRWLADLDVPVVALTPGAAWIDPHHDTTLVADADIALEVTGEPGWVAAWQEHGRLAGRAIDDVLATHDRITEPGVARHLLATRLGGSTLVTSSSMPIRDLESFAHPRDDVRVLANRGANGIDGVTSTALGVALGGTPTTLAIGDLALLHDAGALNDLASRDVDLTIVVIDNTGGGIFSFLPQHDELDHARFDQLFGTPHTTDIAALLDAHRIPRRRVSARTELPAALEWANARTGVRAVLVTSDREANLAIHDELVAAVRAKLG